MISNNNKSTDLAYFQQIKNIPYEVIDVRETSYTYFSKVIIKAGELVGKKNLLVIQKYEPLSLIQFLMDKGWQYRTNKVSDNQYQVFFFYDNPVSKNKTKEN